SASSSSSYSNKSPFLRKSSSLNPPAAAAKGQARVTLKRGVHRQSGGNAPTWRKNRRPVSTSCVAASPCLSVGTSTPPIPDPHHHPTQLSLSLSPRPLARASS
ncbi:unnamed protein product, partial [Linum tenue]